MGTAAGLRVAVVGTGYWGSMHVRVLRASQHVEVVVTVGHGHRRPDGAAHDFSSLERALPHVDAVVVATHPALHAPLALQALAAGKHVLVEKPMATTAADAAALVAAAELAGTVLMVGHTSAHDPAVRVLEQLVNTVDFGTVHHLDIEHVNLGLHGPDVDVVLDLAPHNIAVAGAVLRARPSAVAAWAAPPVRSRHADVARLRLEYGATGTIATLRLSRLPGRKLRRTVAVGSRQMAVYDDLALDERVRLHHTSQAPTGDRRAAADLVALGGPSHPGGVHLPVVENAEPVVLQDLRFVHAARTGSRSADDARRGLDVVRVLEAAATSLREGGCRVPLDEVTHRPRVAPAPGAELTHELTPAD